MKYLSILLFLLLIGCGLKNRPSTLSGDPLAYDSTEEGNVRASATKWVADNNVCFDISISVKGQEQDQALATNWGIAWIDQNKNYHLLKLNQRNPAGVPEGEQVVGPYGSYSEWTNTFRTCAPTANIENVKGLILTSKAPSWKGKRALELNWK